MLIDQLRQVLAAGKVGVDEIVRIQEFVRDSLPRMRAAGIQNMHEGPGRYMLYKDEDFGFVIMMLVWGCGDKTPIHDHGTWGVEGVLQDTIAVTSFTTCEKNPEEVAQMILPQGSVAFVLPPDFDRHVVEHYAGEQAISIHVYGKELTTARSYVQGVGFQELPLTARKLDIQF
jgi:predicted metal-dependent enzyme (double-stranded beta helix superfamily)